MQDKTINRFLIVRTDKIGDVILTIPVITNIRLAYPDAFIGFLGREYTRKILENNPDLNEFIVYDPAKAHKGLKGIMELANLLGKYKFDAAIVVFPVFRAALALSFTEIPARIGVGYRWYSFLFNKREYFHRSNVEKHELEYNLDLLKPLGIEIKDKSLKIFLNDADKGFADNFLNNNGLTGGFKLISVHSGKTKSALNWSIKNYIELINKLSELQGVKAVLVEGKNEENITMEVMKSLKNKPAVLRSDADIKQVAAVIGKMKLHISGNTGTMHIAAAVGTPTISFFNPVRVVSPKRWGPRGNKSVTIQPEGLECKKCNGRKCNKYNCMDLIKVNDVIGKIKELL